MADDAETSTPGRQAKRGPAVDLKGMTAGQLRELIADAETELAAKQQAAKTGLLAKWKAEAAEAGLTLDAVTATGAAVSIGRGKARKPASGNVPVKYRGPGGEEWSGRGRLPKWVQVAEAEGKSREDFKA